jgi:hypothetical protein
MQPATTIAHPAGRLRTGLAHSLAVWLIAFTTMYLAPSLAAMWAFFGAGLLAVLLLAARHRRHQRPDSAVGVYTGAVLWPLLLGATLIAVNIASMSLSAYE